MPCSCSLSVGVESGAAVKKTTKQTVIKKIHPALANNLLEFSYLKDTGGEETVSSGLKGKRGITWGAWVQMLKR